MAGRRILNEQDARRSLAAAKSSRAGLAAWARAHGVDGRSLNAWRVNLERRVGEPRGVAKLVELVPVAAPAVAARYVLRIRGVELEVGDGFNEQTVRRLVGLLRSC
jgi:transposase-like protein